MLTDLERLAAVARTDLTIKVARCSHKIIVGGTAIDRQLPEGRDLSVVVVDQDQEHAALGLTFDWLTGYLRDPLWCGLTYTTQGWRAHWGL